MACDINFSGVILNHIAGYHVISIMACDINFSGVILNHIADYHVISIMACDINFSGVILNLCSANGCMSDIKQSTSRIHER